MIDYLTTEAASRLILARIDSSIMPPVTEQFSIAYIFTVIRRDNVYDRLSSGERAMVDIALAVFTDGTQASFKTLNSLDRATRAYVWSVLEHCYLGKQMQVSFDG